MPQTLFGRIARHGVSLLRNPHEDRLTEVLAAVLASNRCPGLARHLALGWLESATRTGTPASPRAAELRLALAEDGEWTCQIATQLISFGPGGSRRPDLELSFRQPFGQATRHIVLWVEIKHGSSPHTQQLAAYLQRQRERGLSHAGVLLIAPRTDYPRFAEGEMPPDVPRLTWEDTARIVGDYSAPDSVARFLVNELRAYLDEEGLMDPPALTTEHKAALTHEHEAHHALSAACELAASKLISLWGPGESPEYYTGEPSETWWSYRLVAADGTAVPAGQGWDLYWSVRSDISDVFPDAPAHVPGFIAGMASGLGGVRQLGIETCELLECAGFLVVPFDQRLGWEMVVRPRQLPDLRVGLLGEVGADLAAWVNSTFRTLATVLSARAA